jgi:c-di-GMP-binding flagellar brake protein YcgR
MDTQFIYLLMPTNKNGLKAIIRKGDELYVSFVDKKDRRIGFSSHLLDVLNDDDKTLYKIDKPNKEAYSIEFRENFRVDILTDATITYIKGSNISKSVGSVIDISASGAKLSVGISLEDKLEVNDTLFLSFSLNEMELQNIEAKIVRKALSRVDKVNHYGLHFVNLDKKVEDSIIKFCISRQLELARKMRGL